MTARERWEREYAAGRKRRERFETLSFEEVPALGLPADGDPDPRIGYPGQYPYTRGIHPTGYRGRLWTTRQFAGFAGVKETNERFRSLLAKGQNGLSVAFDMPTLMGIDSDDPRSLGEVGNCGVAVDSADDMVTLFHGIPLADVSVSMTINGPAEVLFAFFLVAAEEQGVDWSDVRGTLQNDILKEYIAQKEWIFPPAPHMRIIVDMIDFCTREVPQWNTISISGYHIREAGATAAQELAFTLGDGFAYVEACLRRGLKIPDFAPRLSFFFDAHLDFFEEIAKFRAARRIWARWMRDKYGVTDERSLKLRFHTQTAGVSLTAQQPDNNVVRTAIEALAAVLGGTQSLHTNALDEVYALPTERAAEIALRTQQVIAEETGVANTIDPLGGSWFVEEMTDKVEARAEEILQKVLTLGDGSMFDGTLRGIEESFFQGALADSAYEFEKAVGTGERSVVGVNKYVDDTDAAIETLVIPEEVEKVQCEAVRTLRSNRDQQAVDAALKALEEGARSDANLMELMVDAARVRVTEGEIVEALKQVFGSYHESARI
ncbi:MAG TPA: methylmalonyl-CoA mutase [Actinobacteria bacterium]|nr:methylmalonyl-CoA mutase [Actinomycetota bacterium]HDL50150.1 methylmalonyl-CoA mutase [Actinomycetota bacterium]